MCSPHVFLIVGNAPLLELVNVFALFKFTENDRIYPIR